MRNYRSDQVTHAALGRMIACIMASKKEPFLSVEIEKKLIASIERKETENLKTESFHLEYGLCGKILNDMPMIVCGFRESMQVGTMFGDDHFYPVDQSGASLSILYYRNSYPEIMAWLEKIL